LTSKPLPVIIESAPRLANYLEVGSVTLIREDLLDGVGGKKYRSLIENVEKNTGKQGGSYFLLSGISYCFNIVDSSPPITPSSYMENHIPAATIGTI